MKCKVLQESLAKSLKVIRLAVSQKGQLPILSCILFEVKDNELTLSGTDLYLGIKSQIICEGEENGIIAIPAKMFSEIVLSLDPGVLSLEIKENTLTIKSGKTKSELQIMNPDEFPEFPENGGEKLSLDKKTFEKIMDFIPFAASKDETRPALTSVLFSLSKKSEIVATDGFRLSSLFLNQEFEDQEIKVPAKSLQEVYRVINDEENETEIQFNYSKQLKQVFFTISNFEIFIRLIEAEYPPYKKIMPEEFETVVELNAKELETLVKRACIIAKEASYIITFDIEEDKLRVKSSSSSVGKHEGEMQIKNLSSGKIQIAFNAQYILDFLSKVHDEEILLSVNDNLAPAQFQIKGNEEYKYIVMPFRLQN